jgi:uncharacterized low-complexity protein
MSKKTTLKPLAAAMGAAFVTSLAGTGVANAADNPFAMSDLSSGYMVAENHAKGEEGKCGEKMKSEEGKCGEKMKSKEGKCGEGKCGEKKEAHEGKCGEKTKSMEGKCGEKKDAE